MFLIPLCSMHNNFKEIYNFRKIITHLIKTNMQKREFLKGSYGKKIIFLHQEKSFCPGIFFSGRDFLSCDKKSLILLQKKLLPLKRLCSFDK